jgi:hypothetical protein
MDIYKAAPTTAKQLQTSDIRLSELPYMFQSPRDDVPCEDHVLNYGHCSSEV